MPRVMFFEVQAENPERAMMFYNKTFGWEFSRFPGSTDYWLIASGEDEPGINGGLLRRRGGPPVEGQAVNAFVCTIEVANVDEALKSVTGNGGQNVVPKMPIPTVGWLAYCNDTEGNIFGIMQPDSAAA